MVVEMKKLGKQFVCMLLAALVLSLGFSIAADDADFEKDWLSYEGLTADYTKNDDGTYSVNAWNWFGQRLYKKPVGADVTIEMAVSNVQEGAYWGLIVRADSLEGQSTTVEKMNACVARVIRAGSEFDSSLYLYGRKGSGESMATSKPVDSDLSKEHVMRLVARGNMLSVYYDDMYTPVITFENNAFTGEYVGIYNAINIGAIIHYVKINDSVVLGEYDGIVEKLNPNPPETTQAPVPSTTQAAPESSDGENSETPASSKNDDIFVVESTGSAYASALPSQSSQAGSGSNTGLIVGIVLGVLVVGAGAFCAVYFLVIKKKKKAK